MGSGPLNVMNQSTETDWSKCSLFQHCSQAAVIDEVVAKASAKVYKKGGVLIDKGQVPPALFVIEDRKVGIYIEDILLDWVDGRDGESFLAHGIGDGYDRRGERRKRRSRSRVSCSPNWPSSIRSSSSTSLRSTSSDCTQFERRGFAQARRGHANRSWKNRSGTYT